MSSISRQFSRFFTVHFCLEHSPTLDVATKPVTNFMIAVGTRTVRGTIAVLCYEYAYNSFEKPAL